MNHLKGVKPVVISLIKRALDKSSHDFGIPEYGGKRSTEDQEHLYAIGRTIELDRKPITHKDGVKSKSIHQFGMAFDIFLYDEHGACWKCTSKYKEIADVIKAEFLLMQKEGHFCTCEKLCWGGDWVNFKDLPHFEIKKK